MNEKIVFVRTSSGEDEVRSRTAHLSKDIKRALLMVDGTATVAEIMKRSSPSLRGMLEDMFAELARGGFIRDKSKVFVKPVEPVIQPAPKKSANEVEELDFTAAYRAPTPAMLEAEAAKLKLAEVDAKAVVESKARLVAAEKARLKENTDKFKALRESEIVRIRAEQEAASNEAEARSQAMAEERAMLEAEVAQLKAKAEVESRARAAAEEKARVEANAAKAQAERLAHEVAQVARLKAEQETARVEAEARAREQMERHAREKLEAARKTEQKAAQLKAEMDARTAAEERARLESEVANFKAQAEAESRARVAAEEKARQEADTVRAQVERMAREQAQAARLKAEQETARVEAEARAREQAEQQARVAAEAARVKAEQHAAQVKVEAEARSRVVAEERAKLEAEVAKLKEQAEAEAKKRVAVAEQVRLEAEVAKAKAQQEMEAAKLKAQQEMEAAKLKAQQEMEVAKAKAQQEAERVALEAQAARVKAEQEAIRVRDEVEQARQRAAAEILAREEAERVAREAKVARVHAEQEAARIQTEAKARIVAAETAALKVQQEAERIAIDAEKAARIKAEQEMARIKAEAETRAQTEKAQQQAEEERRKIAQAAAKVREAVERAKQLAEVKEHEEAARRANEVAESLRAEQARLSVAQARRNEESEAQTNSNMLAAIVRLNAKHASMEESVFSALDELAQQEAESFSEQSQPDERVSHANPAGKSVSTAVSERRTTIAAVVFFDIVGYSAQLNSRQIELKNQLNELVAGSIDSLGNGERVLLDTGDGVAIGFLQHPTDALETAMHFRNGLMANKHYDHPDLRVRIGLHLGPVSLVKDMNGQINMLGDGINSAQRVMSFAGNDQIFVSRAYFDFVSSLSDEYDSLFRYRGSHPDKHGREFQVYELLDADGHVADLEQVADNPIELSIDLTGFNFEAFDTSLALPGQQETSRNQPAEPHQEDIAGQLLRDAIGLGQLETAIPPAESAAVPQPDNQAEKMEHSVEAQPQTDAPERLFSEEEAKKLADVQAKKWAEAERRAAELARKKAETASNKVFQAPVEEVAAGKTVTRTRRRQLPWGKLVAGVCVLLVTGLFIIPAALPTQGYVTRIEQLLSKQLQQPVHIGRLSGRILPRPRLVLSEVSIGETKQIQAHQAQVNFAFSALFGPVKSIDTLELNSVQVNGAALPQVSDWLQQVAADRQYPVARIVLSKGQLEAESMTFSNVDGELDFDPSGKFTQARLNANGHKLVLDIHATPEQKMQLSLTLRDSALPLLPNWVFDELKADGELTRDELHITDLDGRIMGGVLTGDARINWHTGWRVQGALVAKVIPLQNINKLLSGDLDGTAHFQMQSESLAKLTDAAILNGVFSVQKGVISGMDIVEITRLRSRESLPGGRTHFDELIGELAYANDGYQFRQMKMNDSMVRAVGSVSVARQQLSGTVSANLTMRAGMGTVSLLVGGTTESPSLRAAK